MGHGTRWRGAIRFLPERTPVRGVLVGLALLTLALGATGLCLTTPAAAPAHVRVAGEAAAPAFRPRPTRTPPPTSTPMPTPTVTIAPSPTVTPTALPTTTAPTAAATGTSGSGTTPTGQAGSGAEAAQTPSPLGALLGWGLGALVVAVLGFGVLLVLFTRRTARAKQHPAFALPAQRAARARLNQLHQLLPTRQGEPPLAAGGTAETRREEGHAWEPLGSPPKPPRPVPLQPPRWLIESGWLKGDYGDLPTADPQELWERGKAVRGGPHEGRPGQGAVEREPSPGEW